MASNASQSPTNGNANGAGLRRRKTVTQEKKIADDEFMAAAIGDVEWLKQSLRANRGAVTFDKNGLSPIHLAAIHGRTDCLKVLVEKFKVDVNLGSTTGWRPAHLCISNQTGKRAYQSLAYLLEKNADPSIANDDGITPMHQAASEGHVQCLKGLIEAGGTVIGVDARGHTPLDLAKLWGHRKCARLLATERWQQDKQFYTTEMKQLQKLKMHQVLEEIEKDEELKADQAFYGERAFKEWLDSRGLDKGNNGPPTERKQAPKKETKTTTQKSTEVPKESTQKANSLQKPGIGKKQPSTIKEESSPLQSPNGRQLKAPSPTDGYRTPFTHSTEGDKDKEQEKPEVPEQLEKKEEDTDDKALWYNEVPWNKSTFVPERSYEPILPDHYPHDEYTMKPKVSPKRDHPKKKQSNERNSAVRMPQLPQDVIDKKLNPGKYERPVVYKCKHISDVHKKFHYDNDKLPRQEAGLHLIDDLTSMVFKAGLQVKGPKSTSTNNRNEIPKWFDDVQLKKSAVSLEKMDKGVVNTFKRMTKPTSYPAINGDYYELGIHG